MAEQGEKKILCVGLVCVDIVSVCNEFPREDTDQRSLDYYWQRGGNASNSASVLGILGSNVEFIGTLVKGPEFGFLKSDFENYGINIDNCVIHEEGRCPVSVVVINKQNGSRTILAAFDELKEITFEEFNTRVDMNKYKWIHFEGRPNKENMTNIIQKINNHNARVPSSERVKISIELEKPKRTYLKELMSQVDYTFISKEFSIAEEYNCKEEAVREMQKQCKQSGTIVCAWGEDGAAAKSGSCDIVASPIFPPEQLVDTLGAGDTFNAATIFALCKDKCLQDAIIFGCKIAGAKCGMTGNKNLKGLNCLL